MGGILNKRASKLKKDTEKKSLYIVYALESLLLYYVHIHCLFTRVYIRTPKLHMVKIISPIPTVIHG